MAVPGPFFRNLAGNPASPMFARVTLKGHTVETDGTSRPTWNVFDFRRRGTGGMPNDSALMVEYLAQIVAACSAAFSDKYIADTIEQKFLDDPAFLPVSLPNDIVGAVTGDRMPSGNGCVTFRLKCNAAGRAFRGSKHFSPVAESQTTLDVLNAGAITLWNAVGAALLASPIDDLTGNDWDLIVLSADQSDLTVSPAIFTGAYVVTDPLNLRIGTMRRRRQRASPIAT